jgi:hypothetical protein
LPRAQAAVEGIVAAAEALELKSPSSGRHQSVKCLGVRGQSPPSLPTKKPEFPKLLPRLKRFTDATGGTTLTPAEAGEVRALGFPAEAAMAEHPLHSFWVRQSVIRPEFESPKRAKSNTVV